MKKLLLFFLFPVFTFAQINIGKVCNFTQEEAKSYADEIVSLAKEQFRFYKIIQHRESELFIYVPSNISDSVIDNDPEGYSNYETIKVVYKIYMEGKNDDLKTPGVKRYRMERAHGQFLNLFPFWQKYYVQAATLENYKDYHMKEVKKGHSLSKFMDNDGGNWYIDNVFCQ